MWALAAWTVKALVAWLGWLANWPLAVWTVPAAPLWAQLAALLAALLVVLPLPWRLRVLAVPLALPLLLPPRVLPEPGQCALVVADVGQGTAVVLRTREHLLVYDAGPRYSRDSDAGQRVPLPPRRAIGETRIDVLMLCHRDHDHMGGAAALIKGMPVAQVHTSFDAGGELPAGGAAALRGWPALAAGRRDVRTAQPRGAGLRARPQAQRAELRAACTRRQREHPAHRGHRARPGGCLDGHRQRSVAQRDARRASTTAAAARRAPNSSMPSSRGSRSYRPATATASDSRRQKCCSATASAV